MSSKKTRRSYSPEDKAAILRRHLVDKVAISDLCDEYKLQPSVLYGWQAQALENLPAALQGVRACRKVDSAAARLNKEIDRLKQKLVKKDNVIAEVTEEMVALKKELGEP